MKILFVTAHPYLPQLLGGMQMSTHQLCLEFQQRGHKVAVLAGLSTHGWRGFVSRIKQQINLRLRGHKVARDAHSGYPIWRTWFPWEAMGHVVHKERPDIIIVAAGEPVRMGCAAQSTGTPIIMQLQNVEFQLHGNGFDKLGPVTCISNSNFTAEAYRSAYGVESEVIYPFIPSAPYRTETTRENVTFINPIPLKGRDIALRAAELCPDIPFTFVEAWPMSAGERDELMKKLKELPNVTFLPPQKDMRAVYKKCKILLVPSLWNEGYGRVATEAQYSGIPVIASTRGGLPEAVGSGGILIDTDAPAEEWATAIRNLWEDEVAYKKLSADALAYATRPEMGIEFRVKAWEEALNQAVKQGHMQPNSKAG